ncbi:IS630 family transposase [Flammeovirgaceae bacterium SG7u.111]|nr:IS630 family transposase [Flammeovirgaceae bacterium SG7u.132]MDW7694699.1 IS630 family transposase [Flammeovirgaceae bacterium SG7u.132]WPO34407.1 IS630 family transposase [Flammeovirgaceae bacterium SG7u.111]WPO37408.1 IS630 family transposase [Flammeovirgaceae bacterium SG7u.111]
MGILKGGRIDGCPQEWAAEYLYGGRAKKIASLAREGPVTCLRFFAQEVSTKFGKDACGKTVKRILKKSGLVWKRMRNSLENNRDEEMFRFFQQELDCLGQQARQGEIDLCYFDETGISLCPNVPYAWQPVGTANKLPARRGNGVSVLGILDPLANTFTGSYYHGAANSACVIQVLDSFSETITKKTVLVLDNAAIHRSKEVGEAMGKWKKKGLYLQFIPAYCPELNLIEILWKMLKHYWIRPRHYASMQSLIEATLYILQNYGKQYSISFG